MHAVVSKFFEDAAQSQGFLIDDDTKHLPGGMYWYDENME